MCFRIHCVPQNRARILWPITFTNIDQYQCHSIELFLQHYLIIYHKIYSHSTGCNCYHGNQRTRADQRLCYYSAPAHRARATVEYLRQATPDFIFPDVWPPNILDPPVDYRIWDCLQDPCLSESHTRHQRAETAPG